MVFVKLLFMYTLELHGIIAIYLDFLIYDFLNTIENQIDDEEDQSQCIIRV